jgi:hypothetical protein
MKKKLETMKIHGKDYVTVNSRIAYFREKYATGRIHTSIEEISKGQVIFLARIYIGENLVATGHAMEKETSSQINKTSHIENCETSAIGRALGILGIGIEGSVASAEEVENAVNQQMDKQAPPAADMSNASKVSNQRTESPPAASVELDAATWTVPFPKSKNYGKKLDDMAIDDVLSMYEWLKANFNPESKFAGKDQALLEMLEAYLIENDEPAMEDSV